MPSSFLIYCNAPPADGSELRYLVLVEWLDEIGATPMKDLPSDIAERNHKQMQLNNKYF
ncbi:MAG TPA: hypothetical protein VFP49_08945 [Nitrososphaeraceae archaeon]|nr:hypothetical protein [Nitrososphaeraceae archaeon]